jgi:hypothetical protein
MDEQMIKYETNSQAGDNYKRVSLRAQPSLEEPLFRFRADTPYILSQYGDIFISGTYVAQVVYGLDNINWQFDKLTGLTRVVKTNYDNRYKGFTYKIDGICVSAEDWEEYCSGALVKSAAKLS